MKTLGMVLHGLVTVGLLIWCYSLQAQRGRDVDAMWFAQDEAAMATRLAEENARELVMLDGMIGELAKVSDRNTDRLRIQLGQVAEGVLELQDITDAHREAIMELAGLGARQILENARDRAEDP